MGGAALPHGEVDCFAYTNAIVIIVALVVVLTGTGVVVNVAGFAIVDVVAFAVVLAVAGAVVIVVGFVVADVVVVALVPILLAVVAAAVATTYNAAATQRSSKQANRYRGVGRCNCRGHSCKTG